MPMETTYTTINRLAHMFTQEINDKIFCSAIDAGIDPGVAWNSTYEPDGQSLMLNSIVEQPLDIDTFDDVEFASI